jgi:hypothetical protein
MTTITVTVPDGSHCCLGAGDHLRCRFLRTREDSGGTIWHATCLALGGRLFVREGSFVERSEACLRWSTSTASNGSTPQKGK